MLLLFWAEMRISGKIVSTYILRLLALPFVTTFVLTSMILMVMQMLQLGDVVFGTAVSFGFIFRIVVLTLPHFMVFTLPLAVLASLLITFGQMSDENELLALEAGGISPLVRYIAPLLLGAVASIACTAAQFYLEPWSMREVYSHVVNAMKENATYSFQEGTFNDDIPGTVIFFNSKDPEDQRIWKSIFIHQVDTNGNLIFLSAKSAFVRPMENKKSIMIEMHDGVVHQPDFDDKEYRTINFTKNSIAIDIEQIIENRTGFFQSSQVMYPAELRRVIESLPAGSKDRLRMEVMYHKRYATSMMPLFLVMACVPLAAIRSRFGRPLNLGLVMAVLLVYYFFMRVTSSVGEMGTISPIIAAWAPDFLLLALATVTAKVGKVSA